LQLGDNNISSTERSSMNSIVEIKIGDKFRGKGKKGQRCMNPRSPFYGQYLDRTVTAFRYNHDLKTIEVDFEVRSTRGKLQTKTTTIGRFIKWSQGESPKDENLGPRPFGFMQSALTRRTQRASRHLRISHNEQGWELQKASGNTQVVRKVSSTQPQTQLVS
jgi:hypothetical protein